MMDEYTAYQCDVCKVRSFERNHYFHGKLLSARDLADEQRYFNEKRWLINRMVLGWGIVCGLDVTLDYGALVVQPGLALDCCGRELLVCEPRTLKVDKIVEALGAEEHGSTPYPTTPVPPAQPRDYQRPPDYGKPARYAKPADYGKGNQPKDQPTPQYSGRPQDYGTPQGYGTTEYGKPPEGQPYPDYPQREPKRWVLCLEYRECGTEPVKASSSCEQKERGHEYNRIRDDYQLTIRRWKRACPDDHNEDSCPYEGLGRKTPLHQALVERSRTCPACKDCACVVLATGTIDETCQPPEIRVDDDHWKYRRIVYTNDTLASVIRCVHGGLAHITAINWAPGSQFKSEEFLDRLCKDHLQVTFDRPMKVRTVTNPRSCRLSIFLSNNEGSCPVQFLIPVQRIEYDEATATATYHFDDDCIEQELRKMCKRLRKAADVELVLHGSLIHDEHGRALDAELIDEFPTGNGVEAGEFIAYFTVGP